MSLGLLTTNYSDSEEEDKLEKEEDKLEKEEDKLEKEEDKLEKEEDKFEKEKDKLEKEEDKLEKEDQLSDDESQGSANMSLGHITNYTDSEGEETELKEGSGLNKGTPASAGSSGSKKKSINALVNYTLAADELELDDENSRDDVLQEEQDKKLMYKLKDMDIDTDEEFRSSLIKQRKHSLGIDLPPAPTKKASKQLQDTVMRSVENVRYNNKNYNVIIQNKKEFRNPSIYEKLIDLLDLDEMGSNYPLDQFDPHFWINSKGSLYDELAQVQQQTMDKLAKERKDKTKVEFVNGTKILADEDQVKKRKTRFDQVV